MPLGALGVVGGWEAGLGLWCGGEGVFVEVVGWQALARATRARVARA